MKVLSAMGLRGGGAVCAIALIAVLAPAAFADIDAYQFQNQAQEQRYYRWIEELRCPKCQNQNIADSNAPLSQDLRQRVYAMIIDGRSDAEINDFMVTRYGDFITYRPPLKPTTWVLWFGPLLGMIVAVLLLGLWVRRRSREPSPELSEPERKRLKGLLTTGEEPK
jgi:cytochrome c-type biogenesis protein CcmH